MKVFDNESTRERLSVDKLVNRPSCSGIGYKRWLFRTAIALRAAFFPSKCLLCDAFFHPEARRYDFFFDDGCRNNTFSDAPPKVVFEQLMDPFLCPACSTDFLPVESPFCSRCGIMFKSRRGEDHFCGDCIESPKRFNVARAPGIYDRALMGAIHSLKYKGKLQLARPLGQFLFSAFIRLWDTESVDLVVPVPLHVKRLRARGFNQAFLMIKDWPCFAEAFGIKMTRMLIDRHLLVRNRWTEPQTGLDRKKRMGNIKGAFSVSDASTISGKRILLVDDVYTTGATADECSKVLMNSGAGQVDVLTLARAM